MGAGLIVLAGQDVLALGRISKTAEAREPFAQERPSVSQRKSLARRLRMQFDESMFNNSAELQLKCIVPSFVLQSDTCDRPLVCLSTRSEQRTDWLEPHEPEAPRPFGIADVTMTAEAAWGSLVLCYRRLKQQRQTRLLICIAVAVAWCLAATMVRLLLGQPSKLVQCGTAHCLLWRSKPHDSRVRQAHETVAAASSERGSVDRRARSRSPPAAAHPAETAEHALHMLSAAQLVCLTACYKVPCSAVEVVLVSANRCVTLHFRVANRLRSYRPEAPAPAPRA